MFGYLGPPPPSRNYNGYANNKDKIYDKINFLDGMFAIMAIPTIISSVYLSPHVMEKAKIYFKVP